MVRRLIRAVLVCMILLKTVLDATDMQSFATTATENRELATIEIVIKTYWVTILGTRLSMFQSSRHFNGHGAFCLVGRFTFAFAFSFGSWCPGWTWFVSALAWPLGGV